MTDKRISNYFKRLAKQRTDNNRGFNDPEVRQKAIETRKRNAEIKKAQEAAQATSPKDQPTANTGSR